MYLNFTYLFLLRIQFNTVHPRFLALIYFIYMIVEKIRHAKNLSSFLSQNILPLSLVNFGSKMFSKPVLGSFDRQ